MIYIINNVCNLAFQESSPAQPSMLELDIVEPSPGETNTVNPNPEERNTVEPNSVPEKKLKKKGNSGPMVGKKKTTAEEVKDGLKNFKSNHTSLNIF